MRKVPRDKSGPPTLVYDFGPRRVLRIDPADDTILYSTDPDSRYVHNAGDGWLGSWKFMSRGTDLNVSGNRTQLFWLEGSAQGSAAGELTMVTLPKPLTPGGTPRPLARNVRQYTLLGDGRVLCNENYSFPGIFNRLVLVDPARGQAQWLADSANNWTLINHSTEALVDVVTGATSGHDVVRMPVPPPLK